MVTSWGIDSMASLHCSGNKSLFSNMKKCKPISVQVANHAVVTRIYYGTVRFVLQLHPESQ